MHQCPVCLKPFVTPYKLKRHHIIHTGQKPFICELCGKSFTQSAHLKTHSQNVHCSRLPGDCQQDGVLPENLQSTCDKPAAEINTHDKSNYNRMTSAVPSFVAPIWRQEIVADEFVLAPSESGNSPKNIPHLSDNSGALSSTSSLMDPVLEEQDDSASVESCVNKAHNGYTCKVCSESFPSSLQLWIHSKSHSKPTQPEISKESLQTFSKKSSVRGDILSQQLISCKNEITLKHQCPKCFKLFCSPSKLRRHFLIHTGQKPYTCAVCRKTYRQKVHLKSHLSMSNNCLLSASIARKRQMLHNGNQTSDLPPQSSLQQHLIPPASPVNSSVELELQCKISVNTLQGLRKTEIKTDAAEEPEQSLKSSICFRFKEQEQQFLRHKALKPFQCEICNRAFRLEVNLIRHHKIHSNQTELVRSPTPVQDSNTVNWSDFEKIKHFPEASSADPVALDVNVKTETQSDICTDDNGAFNQDADITSTENQSETCPAIRKPQRIPTIHQCHSCSKCFPSVSKLQRHMMIHTGQRPFGCDICGKTFRQKTHLRVHYRTHAWSKYHKQRSLYINRPPSAISWFNTKMATDAPLQGMMGRKKDYLGNSDVSSVTHLHQTILTMNDQIKDNREPENTLLSHMSKENVVVHVRKVSNVTVKRTQTVKSVQNPGNIQHKCFQCLKCFPSASKLERHEMVHTGLRPFRCLICGKTFRQAPHLKTHERTHCKMRPSKPIYQQGNTRKLKLKNQQQLYPRITVHVPPQKKSMNTDSTLSNFEVLGNAGTRLLCSRPEESITEVSSLLNTNSKSKVAFKKRRLHICRICCKNFSSPYKLSRHLVIHSGIRPYRCILCSKTFTQKGHLKIHEHRCRHGDRISDCSQSDRINSNHPQAKCMENLTHTDFNANTSMDQRETQYACLNHYSVNDTDLAHCSEAVDTEWLKVPEVSLKEENIESEQKQTEILNQATDNYSYSLATEFAFEINELGQNQNMVAPPLSHQHQGNAHNVELPCESVSDSSKMLSDGFVSSVVHNYWCEPLAVFECAKCTASFTSKNNLEQHVCSTAVQLKVTESAQRNHCDICFKYFVSPSKLKRHYLVHTGQRPFRCDICGKTFTQSAHVRTHQRTHTCSK